MKTEEFDLPDPDEAASAPELHVTTIEILGRRYKIESAHDPNTIRELADWVDRRIRRIHRGADTGDVVGAAVLTALNIADDYFQTRRALERRETEFAERTRRLAAQLTQAIGPVNEESSSSTDE